MKRWIHASTELRSYEDCMNAVSEQLEWWYRNGKIDDVYDTDALDEAIDVSLTPEEAREYVGNGNFIKDFKMSYVASRTEVRANKYFTNDDHNYAKSTPRNKIQFDHDVIWAIQFYNEGSDLIYDREVNVWAKNYAEARAKADKLCDCFGYPKESCVVQYAYKVPEYWGNHFTDYECDGVVYGE